MKVLFLDIDGVVNCATTTQRHRGTIGIDPYMAFLVGNMVDDLGLTVVLSSSWRHWPDGVNEVREQVCKIFDVTDRVSGELRGVEIQQWLDAHPEVTKYAILDDNSDMLVDQMPNFFHTRWEVGVTPEIIDNIKKHFT